MYCGPRVNLQVFIWPSEQFELETPGIEGQKGFELFTKLFLIPHKISLTPSSFSQRADAKICALLLLQFSPASRLIAKSIFVA